MNWASLISLGGHTLAILVLILSRFLSTKKNSNGLIVVECEILVKMVILVVELLKQCFIVEWMDLISTIASGITSAIILVTIGRRATLIVVLLTASVDFSRHAYGFSQIEFVDSKNLEHLLMIAGCLINGLVLSTTLWILSKKQPNRKCQTEAGSEQQKFQYNHHQASVLSKLTFAWMIPLLLKGYRNPVTTDDLQKITEEERASDQSEKLKRILSSSGETVKGLLKCCLKLNLSLIAIGGLFRLGSDIFSLTCAFSIRWLVDALQSNSTMIQNEEVQEDLTLDEFLSNPFVIAAIILMSGLFQGICSQASSHFSTLAGIRARNALAMLLYEKAVKLPVTQETVDKHEEGEEDMNADQSDNDGSKSSNPDVGHITNLVSEDLVNIREFLWNVHYIWALPLKVFVIGILVHQKVGVPGSVGVAVGVFLIIPLQLLVGKLMSDNNKKIQKCQDRRLSVSNEVIQGMKTIRLSCLENLTIGTIKQARNEELKFLMRDSWLWSVMAFLASVSTLLVATLILGLWTVFTSGSDFDTANIFTTLALLSQLTVCLSVFPVTLPIYIKAILSSKRLCEYFNRQEVSATFTSTDADKNKNNKAIVMENASFTWPCSSPALQDVTLQIMTGSLTMVAGDHQDKSAFMMSLMKELTLKDGEFQWNLMNDSVAYVGPRPWIVNATIKENILLGRPMKEKRYWKVLQACDLEADINILPMKDNTEVGENGVLLSGGQRQRLAIARCLYSKAECTVMDMPFSALDANLTTHIFREGILKILKKRKRTIILSTQRTDFWPQSDWMLVFGNGTVKAQGPFVALKRKDLLNEKDSTKPEDSGIESRTAQERWRLLKNITRLTTMPSRKSVKLTKTSGSSKMPLSRTISISHSHRRSVKRLDSSAHLGFCHNVLVQNSGPIHEEGHHDLALARALSRRFKRIPSLSPSSKCGQDLVRVAMNNSSRQLKAQASNSSIRRMSLESLSGLHFAHRFVARMASNTSQTSNLSGFSDDGLQEEDEEDGLIVDREGWEFEEHEQQGSQFRVLKAYINAGGFCNFVLLLIMSLAFQSTRVFGDNLLKDHGDGFLTKYFIATSCALVMSISATILGQNLGAAARKQLHETFVTKLFKTPLHVYDVMPVGRFMSRLADDLFIVDQKLPSCLQRLTMVSFICLAAIIVNVIQCWLFLAFAIPIMIIYYGVQYFYRKTSRQLQRIESATRSPYLSHLSDTLSSLVTLRAFREERRFVNQFCNLLEANTTALLLSQSGSRWLGVTLDILGSLVVFASVMSCLIFTPGGNGVDAIGFVLNYSLLVPIYLAWVIKFLTDLEHCLTAVERIIEYSDFASEDDENDDHETNPENNNRSHDLHFEGVSLAHDIRPVVHNLCLKIPAGQKVAIVGRSGSGKSTLAGALVRVTYIMNGKITLDNQDIQTWPLKALRTTISLVPQDASIFGGTLRSFLDPLSQLPDSEIISLLGKLSIDLPLSTEIKLSGENLTKAQRQELHLARVLLRKSPVIVLDEATSAIEIEREKKFVQVLIKTASKDGITFINIMHRLTNVMEFDRVLVFGDGRLLEDGPPKELLQKPMGFFSALWRSAGKEF